MRKSLQGKKGNGKGHAPACPCFLLDKFPADYALAVAAMAFGASDF